MIIIIIRGRLQSTLVDNRPWKSRIKRSNGDGDSYGEVKGAAVNSTPVIRVVEPAGSKLRGSPPRWTGIGLGEWSKKRGRGAEGERERGENEQGSNDGRHRRRRLC